MGCSGPVSIVLKSNKREQQPLRLHAYQDAGGKQDGPQCHERGVRKGTPGVESYDSSRTSQTPNGRVGTDLSLMDDGTAGLEDAKTEDSQDWKQSSSEAEHKETYPGRPRRHAEWPPQTQLQTYSRCSRVDLRNPDHRAPGPRAISRVPTRARTTRSRVFVRTDMQVCGRHEICGGRISLVPGKEHAAEPRAGSELNARHQQGGGSRHRDPGIPQNRCVWLAFRSAAFDGESHTIAAVPPLALAP